MAGISVQVVDCQSGIREVREFARSPRPSRGARMGAIAANPFERLVQISQANDRLLEELAAIRRRIVRARDYLNTPGGNARFGATNLAFCKVKHRGVLAQLRANRIEADRILGLDGGESRVAS